LRDTNRSLLIFGLLMLLLAVATGVSIIALVGVFLLLTSFVLPSSPPPTVPNRPVGKPAPRRISPKPAEQPVPASPQTSATQMGMTSSSAPHSVAAPATPPPVAGPQMQPSLPTQPTFTPPLFPTSMFPSSSMYQQPPQAPGENRPGRHESKDEVLELGALVALLKLVFG